MNLIKRVYTSKILHQLNQYFKIEGKMNLSRIQIFIYDTPFVIRWTNLR